MGWWIGLSLQWLVPRLSRTVVRTRGRVPQARGASQNVGAPYLHTCGRTRLAPETNRNAVISTSGSAHSALITAFGVTLPTTAQSPAEAAA